MNLVLTGAQTRDQEDLTLIWPFLQEFWDQYINMDLSLVLRSYTCPEFERSKGLWG